MSDTNQQQQNPESEPDRETHPAPITMDQASEISALLYKSGTVAEDRLRAKCQWEHMTRNAVIMCWGDPRIW